MADEGLHKQIEVLAQEEHAVRRANQSAQLSKYASARRYEVEHTLDRCWDLRRQRDAGLKPVAAQQRPLPSSTNTSSGRRPG